MIDWISAKIPFLHDDPINAGRVVSISANGEIDWSVEKRLEVVGSHDERIQIKSILSGDAGTLCTHLQLHGNPVKFLQGHNVWGTDDLHGLLTETLIRIFENLGFEINAPFIARAAWNARLSRIDLTQMFDLGNSDRVQTYIRAASANASLEHRGRGIFSGNTLYWGKNSQRWALKMYAKGLELKAHKPRCANSPVYLDAVTAFADSALRVELVLRGKELLESNRYMIHAWDESTVDFVYSSYLSKLKFSENTAAMYTNENLKKISPRLIGVYKMWLAGEDLKELYAHNTYYRYRRELLKCLKIDINIPPADLPNLPNNVIPLRIVLEAKPMAIPYWARGTPLYFEPRSNFL